MITLPQVQSAYFQIAGGLDLQTPAISLPSGRAIDAQNYEPSTSGGYSRIEGFERFDGQSSPTDASYWTVDITLTGTVSVSDTITGSTSASTAKVLAVESGYLVLGALVGTFVLETFTVSAVVQGSITNLVVENGANTQQMHADYKLLSANNQRLNILTVPGSGKIRGVWVYKDVVYAFRDNAGGTAGDMYKQTGAGWVQVSFGIEVQFTNAVGQINVGDTVTQGGVSGVCVAALLRTGTWTAAGAGTLVFASLTGGSFAAGALQVSAVTKVTSSGASSQITRLAGGSNGIIEFSNYNFTGSLNSEKMYGADGVNLGFEFDGTTYVPIRTGMATDTPYHVITWKNYLIYSFLGSVQISSITSPYSWTVVTGAAEISTGSPVTGFLAQGGTQDGSSLAIFTTSKTFILYGTSTSDFKLVPSSSDLGFRNNTMQLVGNDTYGLTARGLQKLSTTLSYGDFLYASVSFLIQKLMLAKQGLSVSSTSLKEKSQYRIYFTDGTGLIVGLTGQKPNGIMPLNYGKVVRCITTATLSTGEEVTYFGSDDGYVYQESKGTSFDGETIESWVRLAFNHEKSPQMKKRFRRATLELSTEGYGEVNVSYDFGYGALFTQSSEMQPDQEFNGGGGYWDASAWDSIIWDGQFVENNTLQLSGTSENISLLFYSNRAQDSVHTLQGVTMMYTPRRLSRGH